MFRSFILLLILFISVYSLENQGPSNPESVKDFKSAGFDEDDYNKAQTLDLNLTNYTQYKKNKKSLLQGKIMTGVGAGLTGGGAVITGLGGILYAIGNSDNPAIDDINFNYSTMGIVYMGLGGAFAVGGITTLIVGSIKKANSRTTVNTRSGGTLSIDYNPSYSEIGLTYSIDF